MRVEANGCLTVLTADALDLHFDAVIFRSLGKDNDKPDIESPLNPAALAAAGTQESIKSPQFKEGVVCLNEPQDVVNTGIIG